MSDTISSLLGQCLIHNASQSEQRCCGLVTNGAGTKTKYQETPVPVRRTHHWINKPPEPVPGHVIILGSATYPANGHKFRACLGSSTSYEIKNQNYSFEFVQNKCVAADTQFVPSLSIETLEARYAQRLEADCNAIHACLTAIWHQCKKNTDTSYFNHSSDLISLSELALDRIEEVRLIHKKLIKRVEPNE
jgi:hypothetical protein